MAVDRPSDHVGNHGGAYTDIDGMRRQFTVIDHDKKTTIAAKATTEEELAAIKKQLGDYRFDLMKRITAISASLCPPVFVDFTIRGDIDFVTWNTDMLLDAGVPVSQLRDLCTLVEKRAEELT